MAKSPKRGGCDPTLCEGCLRQAVREAVQQELEKLSACVRRDVHLQLEDFFGSRPNLRVLADQASSQPPQDALVGRLPLNVHRANQPEAHGRSSLHSEDESEPESAAPIRKEDAARMAEARDDVQMQKRWSMATDEVQQPPTMVKALVPQDSPALMQGMEDSNVRPSQVKVKGMKRSNIDYVVARKHLHISSKVAAAAKRKAPEELTPRQRRARVAHEIFDWVVAITVLVNGVFIGIQTDLMATEMTDNVPVLYTTVELVCGAIFLVELIFRLCMYRCSFFFMDGRGWNIFDMILVLLQVFETIGTIVIADTSDDNRTMHNVNLGLLRMLRFLRLLRIFRMVRLMKYVSELNIIVRSVMNSLRSLCWTMLLLLMLMYILGVVFTQTIHSYKMGHFFVPSSQGSADLSERWGTLGRSILSLYESILGGVDWDDIITPLAVHISPVLAVFFAIYIAFALLAMMNVITGVFVDSALKNAEMEKESDFLRICGDFFCVIKDMDGNVSYTDFCKQMASTDFGEYVRHFGVEPEDAKLLFRLLDKDETGYLPIQELFEGLLRLRSSARFIDVQRVLHLNGVTTGKWQKWAKNMEDNVLWLGSGMQDLRRRNVADTPSPKNDDSPSRVRPPNIPSPQHRPRRNQPKKGSSPVALWHPFALTT